MEESRCPDRLLETQNVPRASTVNRGDQGEKRPSTGEMREDPNCPGIHPDAFLVACFYVSFRSDEEQNGSYYAVYLTERTARELAKKICEKQNILLERICRVLHCHRNGLRILVDDDVVRELPEGQDMVAEFLDIRNLARLASTPLPYLDLLLTY
ncbi:hypothetical protein BBP40_011842 [Aspergillus hancockii]|nr:hypothetical protein BBP40_011842 [Aspergillus hancockii]